MNIHFFKLKLALIFKFAMIVARVEDLAGGVTPQ